MQELLTKIEAPHRKAKLPQIRPGDTVRIHQAIREGSKKRIQVFEGVVIRMSRPNSLSARVVVRKISSGIGVEKSWLLHSPNVTKIEVVKRTKVRRAYLTYLRERRGKSARLAELGFDKEATNASDDRTQAQIDEDAAKAQDAKASDKPSDSETAKTDAADILEDNTGDKDSDAIDSVEIVESTEDLAKEEDKEASQADPANDADEVATSGGAIEDDAQIAAEETQEGIDRAEDKTTRDQDKQ